MLAVLRSRAKNSVPVGRGKLRVAVAFLACTEMIVALSTSSQAQADCVRTYNFGGISSTTGDLVPQASPLISIINTVNTAFLTNTTSFVSAPAGPRPDQPSGGVWARTIGGTVDSTSDSTSTPDFSKVTGFFGPPFVATGMQKCQQTNNQDYAGFQIGGDVAKLNIGNSGANWHFGITAGNFYARAEDTTLNSPDLKARFEVPFIGAYTAMTQGNFFADAQVRWDFYRGTLSSGQQLFSGVPSEALGLSVTASAGYRIALASNWFIEPSVGAVWSRTKVDPVITPFDGGPETTSLRINDIDSILGRASLRLGTNVTQGDYTWQPFITASVVHEFAKNVTSAVTINAPGDAFDQAVFNSSTERFGTYGQFGLGTAIVVGNTGWLGYGRADVKVGENVQGAGFNLGLRYQW